MAHTMGNIPNEIWLNIGQHLSLSDCRRLGQTCHQLGKVSTMLLEEFVKDHDIELIIGSKRDFSRIDFLRAYLPKRLKLKIAVPELTMDHINFLRDVFEVCPHIEGKILWTKYSIDSC